MSIRPAISVVLPQVMTAGRVVLGAAAIVAASEGRLEAATTCIILGALTDGLDGMLSRRWSVATPFGALFDYFADYGCFVIAPWALARALVAGQGDWMIEVAIGAPLVTGAIRYAKNGLRVTGATGPAGDLPGLGTIFCAFLPVTAAMVDAPAIVGKTVFTAGLAVATAVFALLMVVPIRYPKLSRFRGALPAVLVLLAIMPFAGSRVLAAVALAAGSLYALLGPLWSDAVAGSVAKATEDRL